MTFQAKRVSDIAKSHSGKRGGGGGWYRQHFDSWNAGADVFIWSLHFGDCKSIYPYIYIYIYLSMPGRAESTP